MQKEFHFGSFHIRINWLVAACVIITALTFGRLGLWQLDRAAEKVEAQRELEAELRESAPPIETMPAAYLFDDNPDLLNRHVTLTGRYLNDRAILLLAEFFDSQIGYGVVTPFQLANDERVVLVHRGWTSGILPAGVEPDLRPVEGRLTLKAQIHVPPANARVIASEIDPSQWPLRMRSLEIDVLDSLFEQPLFPYEVRLTPEQPGVLVRHWPAVDVNVNQNLSYAVQWFGLALLVVFAALLYSSNLWALMNGEDRPSKASD